MTCGPITVYLPESAWNRRSEGPSGSIRSTTRQQFGANVQNVQPGTPEDPEPDPQDPRRSLGSQKISGILEGPQDPRMSPGSEQMDRGQTIGFQ